MVPSPASSYREAPPGEPGIRLEATNRIDRSYFIVQSSYWVIYSSLKRILHMPNRLNIFIHQPGKLFH